MSTLIEALSQKVKTLGIEDRARLAEELLASLDDVTVDSEVDAAWEGEIHNRVEQIKTGSVRLISADEVFAETARIYK